MQRAGLPRRVGARVMASRGRPKLSTASAVQVGSASGDVGAPTLASQLESQIRDDIINGQLVPGERLRLSKLTGRYWSGPIPLREALSRLLASGLVVAEDQKGFRVSDVSVDEFVDLSNVRARIETMALRESIETAGIDWEVRVIAAHHRLAQSKRDAVDIKVAGFDERLESCHREFHLSLVSGCNSPILFDFMRSLVERSTRYARVSILAPRAGSRDADSEHSSLLDAALARNADKACALLEEHFARTRELVRSVFEAK